MAKYFIAIVSVSCKLYETVRILSYTFCKRVYIKIRSYRQFDRIYVDNLNINVLRSGSRVVFN